MSGLLLRAHVGTLRVLQHVLRALRSDLGPSELHAKGFLSKAWGVGL